MIQPEPEGSTQGYPLVSVEVLSHGPSDAMHNPPKPLKVSQQTLVSFLTEITHISIDFLIPKHQSDMQVFTMTMEILLEPTSNKLMVLLTVDVADPRRVTIHSHMLIPDQEIFQDNKSRKIRIQVKDKGTSSILKSMLTKSHSQRFEVYELKTTDEA
ncbi:hypothetical protein Tco_0908119 [Tanacetum coccineum]|uniref:Uncharacterized protein n=1 Tax=Tanacetum coccineum TaxID=301880 RepID=A0ABQ5CMB7_9ASTR